MILVTVGTAGRFEELLRKIDTLVEEDTIKEPVLCQIGVSRYTPRHALYYRWKPFSEFEKDIERAEVIISHGGGPTIIQCILKEKKIIAVPNRDLADDHQFKFVSYLERYGLCRYCYDLDSLGFLYKEVAAGRYASSERGKEWFKSSAPNLFDDLVRWIESLDHV